MPDDLRMDLHHDMGENMTSEWQYEVVGLLSPDLRQKIAIYIEAEKLPIEHMTRTDIALALLRINSTESLAAAEGIMGVKVKRLPPAIPPWPPLPVATRAKPVPRIVQVNHSAHFTQSD